MRTLRRIVHPKVTILSSLSHLSSFSNSTSLNEEEHPTSWSKHLTEEESHTGLIWQAVDQIVTKLNFRLLSMIRLLTQRHTRMRDYLLKKKMTQESELKSRAVQSILLIPLTFKRTHTPVTSQRSVFLSPVTCLQTSQHMTHKRLKIKLKTSSPWRWYIQTYCYHGNEILKHRYAKPQICMRQGRRTQKLPKCFERVKKKFYCEYLITRNE